jgi:tRNA(Ile)-lysidine synthase
VPAVRRPPAVARVLERVTATVRRYEMVRSGDLVLVSVSGGPDSICLLHAMWYLRRLLRIRLEVFHFDHRLRPGSPKDAAYVDRVSARLRLPFHLVEAPTSPRAGDSIEAWGHDARTRARRVVARDVGAAKIATAHTLDDQAETVLMRALSGSGTRGIAGIRPVTGDLVRPLFDTTREDVEAFCRALGLRPRRDPSNLDPRFLRNAIRLNGLPALERAVGRSVRLPLARTGDLAREDDDELSRQASAVWDRAYRPWAGGAILRTAGLGGLPRPVAARVVAEAIYRCGSTVRRSDVEAILDLALGRTGREVDLFEGLKARRDRGYVRLVRASPDDPTAVLDEEGGA